MCSAEGHKTLCEKNNLSETKIEVSGVKLEINSFVLIFKCALEDILQQVQDERNKKIYFNNSLMAFVQQLLHN